MTRFRVYATIVLLFILGLACSAPLLPVDKNAFSTAVAETVIAGLTQDAPAATFTPTLTSTLETPTVTNTPTETLTPTLTVTPLVLIPEISVSVDTNCRNGPGKTYDRIGALLVGESAQVYGVDPTKRYWYIPNPDADYEYCWVWDKYATFTGSTSLVPVMTPPPTPTATSTPLPTPDFSISYSSSDLCAGWWVELVLKNTGEIPFKSVAVTIKDIATEITLSNLTNGFVDINGCLTTNTTDTLSPGSSVIVSAPAFAYDPAGNKMIITVTLCSKTGQNGTCITKTVKFKL